MNFPHDEVEHVSKENHRQYLDFLERSLKKFEPELRRGSRDLSYLFWPALVLMVVLAGLAVYVAHNVMCLNGWLDPLCGVSLGFE